MELAVAIEGLARNVCRTHPRWSREHRREMKREVEQEVWLAALERRKRGDARAPTKGDALNALQRVQRANRVFKASDQKDREIRRRPEGPLKRLDLPLRTEAKVYQEPALRSDATPETALDEKQRDLVLRYALFRLLSAQRQEMLRRHLGLDEVRGTDTEPESIREIARSTGIPRERVAREINASVEVMRAAFLSAGHEVPRPQAAGTTTNEGTR